jgi:hypothetical protein
LYGYIIDWQAARRDALRNLADESLPRLRVFIDLPADGLVAVTRLALGALAGWLFHSQLVGSEAAIAVGASAPALLRPLSSARTVREAIQSDESRLAEGSGLISEVAARRRRTKLSPQASATEAGGAERPTAESREKAE